MTIGNNIKSHRKAKGFTQAHLASLSNISRSYLGDIEGDRYNPSIDTLKSIAAALGVDISMLLQGTTDTTISLIPSTPQLALKEQQDIAHDLDMLLQKIDSKESSPLFYKGKELTSEEKELFKDALEFALKRIK